MFSSNTSQVSSGGANYIEDVFSTYLYTGNESTQTIINGIDLSGKGGLVILKGRSGTYGADWWGWNDTSRGVSSTIFSNTTDAAINSSDWNLSSFNADGFSLDPMGTNGYAFNNSATKYASWTFRKQPKFFDVVTYTGNGGVQNISHSLGSAPGCIIIKNINSAAFWAVYHRSTGSDYYMVLNATDDAVQDTAVWNNTAPTSTQFSLGNSWIQTNQSGETYVAYLFAHDAGGFGLTGTDNVISCGSYVGGGSPSINVGFEPQWLLVKKAVGDSTNEWKIVDNMRGFGQSGQRALEPNTSLAEGTSIAVATATGFNIVGGSSAYNTSGHTYIYIAIRRGPMKVPTSGTEVFATVARSGTGSSTALTSPNIVTDMAWIKQRTGYDNPIDATRLIGPTKILFQNSTSAEVTDAQSVTAFDSMTGYTVGTGSRVNASGSTYANWVFKRAPSVFDVVCYSGTGSAMTVSHNLTVAPELMIVKKRSSASSVGWFVYCAYIDVPYQASYWLGLNKTTAADGYTGAWNATNPTASVFTVGTDTDVNASGSTYVAYLFATCTGVSKVGSYTGTGTLTTINCGFTSGARFVMIKRTDSTGPWYIWDTARGMVAGTDPSLMINDSEIEVNANSIYTASTGFQLLASPSVDINTSGGTYIYLAMA